MSWRGAALAAALSLGGCGMNEAPEDVPRIPTNTLPNQPFNAAMAGTQGGVVLQGTATTGTQNGTATGDGQNGSFAGTTAGAGGAGTGGFSGFPGAGTGGAAGFFNTAGFLGGNAGFFAGNGGGGTGGFFAGAGGGFIAGTGGFFGGVGGTGGVGTAGASAPGNRAPVAGIALQPQCLGDLQTDVTLISTSVDPDEDALRCTWTMPAGIPNSAEGCVVPGVAFLAGTDSEVDLVVEDGRGGQSGTTATIRPCANPANGQF
jgi:hypothetical protein